MTRTMSEVAVPAARDARAPAIPTTNVWTRFLLVGLVAVYVATFHFSYVTSIAPNWGYTGLVYQTAADDSLWFAFIAAWLPALAMPIGASRPSDVILWILYAAAYIPAVIVPYYVLGSGWDLLPLTVTLLVSMCLFLLAQRHTSGRIDPPVILSGRGYGWAVVGISLAFAAYVASVFGVTPTLPDLDSVYDVRSAYADNLAETGSIVAYAVVWSGRVLGPLLLTYGIGTRRIPFAVTGLLVMLFIYSTTGYKSVVVLIPLIAGIMFALKFRPRLFGLLVPTALTILILLAQLLGTLLDSVVPTSLAVRRLLDVPGQLTAYYYEFFASHQTYALSHSILQGVVEQPYPVRPPAMIAFAYGIDASPNANLWADGMANFGLPGLVAATLVAIVLLKVFDAVARDRPLHVTGAFLGAASLSLVNSGVLTAILTHGLAVAAVLVLFMPLASPEAVAPTPGPQGLVPRTLPTEAPHLAYARSSRLDGRSR
jgi:hypothetical protein